MTDNPFDGVDAWEPGGGFLPAGDHKCRVAEIDGSTESSGNHPQIVVTVGNDLGSSTDKIVVIDSTLGKVWQFLSACGLEKPSADEVAPSGDGYVLDPKYLAKVVGKEVGVIVRPEQGRSDPTRTFDVIQSYVEANKVESSGMPFESNDGNSGSFETVPGGVPDDDIPF